MNVKKGSKKFSFDVRGVEAWAEPEGGWTWNQSWHLGTMETAGDPRQALPDFLRRHCQIRMKRGFFRIVDDVEIIEIRYRKTDEPVFAAIPNF